MTSTVVLMVIVLLVVLMLLRMPVGFSMFLAGFIGLYLVSGPDVAFKILSGDIWEQLSSYSLSVIPLFIFMGEIAFYSGVTEKLYEAAYKWVGSLRGGLAATTVVASAGFAAICGSNAATAATMGTIALPQMKKYDYSPILSGASVACGGTLGVLIPPSVVLIVIALQTEQSVGKLFLASFPVGFLLTALFLLTIMALCYRNPKLGPAGSKSTLKEKFAALPGGIETLILFLLVIGGLYKGWFTPTEAGAAGSFGALIIALARRSISWKGFKRSVLETVSISAMVMMLVAGAVVFGRFLTITRFPFMVADWAAALAVPPVVILLVITVIYILGGMFTDALGFLVVTIPVFWPLAMSLGYDPAWFSIYLNVLTTMGAITPPVGVCAYIVSGIDPDIPLHTVFKGVLYFVPAYLVCIAIMYFWPEITMLLLPGAR